MNEIKTTLWCAIAMGIIGSWGCSKYVDEQGNIKDNGNMIKVTVNRTAQ